MNLILVFLLSAIAAYGEISFGTASRIRRGAGAPSSGDCAASNDVGKVYIQNDLGASGSPIFACSQSGASSYSWQQASGGGGGGGGATTALDNLASVSINASLIPQSAKALGAAATPWQTLCLYGSGTFGSHSWCTAGTPTGNRTLTLPDASITVAGSASALTSTRVPFATTGGLLTDSAGFTFSDSANVRLATLAGGSSQSTNPLLDVTNSAGSSHHLTVLGSGNVGVGTNTPKLAFQVGNSAGLFQPSTNYADFVNNAYYSGGWKRTTLGGGAMIEMDPTGSLSFNTFVSGAADSAITFVTPAFFKVSGEVGLGKANTTPANTTLSILDATPASGSTATWIGHNGSGTYSGTNLSATATKLTVVAGLTQGATNLQEWTNASGVAQMSFGSGGLLFADNTYSIGASNASRPSSLYVVTRVNINNAASLRSTADGTLLLYNNGESDFNRLQFGGTTSSHGAIGRDSVNGFTIQSAAATATWNDASTAASGTVANRYLFGIAAPTLTATNASVTDTVASTVYIGGAPTASTNTTIGTAYALNVAAGNVNFGGSAQSPMFKLMNSAEGTCSSTTRGEIRMVQGSTGVADTVRACVKSSADTYAWTALF